MKRVDIPEDELRKYFFDEKKGAQEIAEIFGCTNQTINARLREYGIRGTSGKKKIEKEVKIVPGEVIDCNTQGKKCIYRASKSSARQYLCDYCYLVGKCRGGDPHMCTKYKFK